MIKSAVVCCYCCQVSIEALEGGQQRPADKDNSNGDDESSAAELAKAAEEAAEDIVKDFKQDMAKVMENLEKAQLAFDDLSGAVGQCKTRNGCMVVYWSCPSSFVQSLYPSTSLPAIWCSQIYAASITMLKAQTLGSQ